METSIIHSVLHRNTNLLWRVGWASGIVLCVTISSTQDGILFSAVMQAASCWAAKQKAQEDAAAERAELQGQLNDQEELASQVCTTCMCAGSV